MRHMQLDFVRGIAIILMIIFHISFDLNNFHFIDIDIYNKEGKEWFYFRMLILTLFITSVGISLALANENKIDTQKNLKRFILLGTASLFVSIASLVTFPKTWIYFGVLHFITFASAIALPFVKFEKLALIVGGLIIGLFNLKLISMYWLYDILQAPLQLPRFTEDLVSFAPWFGVVLIGIFIGKKRLFLFPIPRNRLSENISYLGKHSLLIYLVHQPIFFGLCLLAYTVLH